jgi:hypothetical protein
MKPRPWSYTALDDFVNCPYAFYRKKVVKDIVEPEAEHLIYGNRVHKDFELHLAENKPLPDDLAAHQGHMDELRDLPGTGFYESELGLDFKVKPCGFWDRNVWFRGKIDMLQVDKSWALIEDYKTGKPHSKFKQLEMFAIHTFTLFPNVQKIEARYYWTQTGKTTGKNFARQDVPELWSHFIPDLKQYAEAFKTDTWQKRQSGLCFGWCPVTDCEFWKQKRR